MGVLCRNPLSHTTQSVPEPTGARASVFSTGIGDGRPTEDGRCCFRFVMTWSPALMERRAWRILSERADILEITKDVEKKGSTPGSNRLDEKSNKRKTARSRGRLICATPLYNLGLNFQKIPRIYANFWEYFRHAVPIFSWKIVRISENIFELRFQFFPGKSCQFLRIFSNCDSNFFLEVGQNSLRNFFFWFSNFLFISFLFFSIF